MSRIIYDEPNIALFNRDNAKNFGLEFAVVVSELDRDLNRRFFAWRNAPHCVPDNSVMNVEGRLWFRYDNESLGELFPYLSVEVVRSTLKRIQDLNALMVWWGSATDFIWISDPNITVGVMP